MISWLGHITLILALLFALFQSIVPLWGYWQGHPYALACARPSAWGQCVAISSAYGLLTFAFATNDFSIVYVAANAHPSLPLLYKLTAVWGAHEGSILLWIVMLNLWTMAFIWIDRPLRRNTALVLASLGLISACFLSFLLFTSNPFTATTIPLAAGDLNPFLQDPGFVMHPPLLYMGYVGFSVAFALTQAALWSNQFDITWSQRTRQFTIAAWLFLTAGITLGSWWAYRVLGWGGFWFWDPVENASLLPWLAGTALIHVLMLTARRGAAIHWAIWLTIICFLLSLLGTFLVRSGILLSVHTFAHDPRRGAFLLLLLAFFTLITWVSYTKRLPTTPSFSFFWSSREMSLLINSVLLFTAMGTVLLGTLYPLIVEALGLGTLSVGAPYFNQVMTPLVLLMMLGMGWSMRCHWSLPYGHSQWQQAAQMLALSGVSAAFFLWFVAEHIEMITWLALSMSLWIILHTLHVIRSLSSVTLAHIGFAILIMGIALSHSMSQERYVRVQPGDLTSIGPYQFYFAKTQSISGPNYRGIQADFIVTKNHHFIAILQPEKRIYPVRDTVITHVAIHPGLFRDLYLALGEPLPHDYWSVRLYYKPFIRWIWLGGIFMVVGALLALYQQRKTNE